MRAIPIKNGIIHLAESKAICPHCEIHISFDEIEEIFQSQNEFFIKHRCKCQKIIGITQDIRGDYVAYELIS